MRYFVQSRDEGGPAVNILRLASDPGAVGDQWIPESGSWVPNAYLTVDREKEPGWREISQAELPAAFEDMRRWLVARSARARLVF